MDIGTLKKSGSTAIACLAMLGCSSYAWAESDVASSLDSASVTLVDFAKFKLEKSAFTLGISYSQVTYKTTHANANGNTQITDNGGVAPIIELNSREKVLGSWPMYRGSAIIGWDVNASMSFFNTHDQLVNSAFKGQDIGTKVTGGYLGVAPTLFLKMGPLYSVGDIYWKVGYGIGPGVFKGSGTALFNTPAGQTVYDVGSNSAVFAIYNSVSTQLQVNNWYFDIVGKWLLPQDGKHTSLESYGVGVAYRFDL